MADYILGTESELRFTTDGSGATGWTRLGLTLDGTMTDDSEAREQRAIGDHRPIAIREGLVRSFGNARFAIQNIAFLSQVLRSGGRLPNLAFEGGQPTTAPSAESCMHTYAKVDTLQLECAAGGEVIASIDWKARVGTLSGSGFTTLAPSANQAFMWYESSLGGLANIGTEAADGGGLEVISFNLRLENNVDWLPIIGTSAGRRATYMREGIQRVTLGLRVLIRPGTNILAATLSYISSVALNLSNGTQNVTVLLSDLLAGAIERPLRPEDLGAHGLTFAVRSLAIS